MRKWGILLALGVVAGSAMALDDLPLYLDEGGCASGGSSFADASASSGTLTLAISTWKVGTNTRTWNGIPVNCTDAHTGVASLDVEVKSDITPGGYYYFFLKWADDTKKSLAGYKYVKFWIKNLLGTPETVRLDMQDEHSGDIPLVNFSLPMSKDWVEVSAPLTSFAGFDSAVKIYGFGFKWTYPDKAQGSALHVLLDDIRFTDGDHDLTIPSQAGGTIPANWPNHFLVSRMDIRENKNTQASFQVGEYRYQYIMSSTYGDSLYVKNYAMKSNEMGVKSAFVWYNFGASGENQVAQNLQSSTYMSDYISRYENLLSQMADANGKDYIIVLEPDMYGKLMQNGYFPNMNCADLPVDVSAANAVVGKIFPSNFCGLEQYLISRAKSKLAANGLVIGHMLNHWGVNIPFQVGQGRIEAHVMGAQAQARFLNSLGDWKGDVVFVEKTDRDAGVKATGAPAEDWFWDSTNYAKYFTWTRILSANSGLRVVGWQVSEGNSTHPVAAHRDDAAEYFLAHPKEWVEGGFIGILFGPGLVGNANYGDDDDGGWFLQHMMAYNKSPYPLPSSTSVVPRFEGDGKSIMSMTQLRDGIEFLGFSGAAVATFRRVDGKALLTRTVEAGSLVPRESLPKGPCYVRLVANSASRTFALLPE